MSAAPSTTIAGAISSKAARDRHRAGSRRVPAEGDVSVAGQPESHRSGHLAADGARAAHAARGAGLPEPRAARLAIRRHAQRGLQRRRSDAVADGQGLREHHHAAARAADAHQSVDRGHARAARRRPRTAGDRGRSHARSGNRAEQAGGRRVAAAGRVSAVPEPRSRRSEQERLRAQAYAAYDAAVRLRAGRRSRRSCATPIARRRGRRPR